MKIEDVARFSPYAVGTTYRYVAVVNGVRCTTTHVRRADYGVRRISAPMRAHASKEAARACGAKMEATP